MATIISDVWGGKAYEITQPYGVNLDNVPDEWYEYATDHGLPSGTHVGIDVAMPRGTPIYAAAPGEVTYADNSKIYHSFRPKPVFVVHDDDPNTARDESGTLGLYGHLWTNMVRTGDRVEAGQQLGTSGEQTVRGTMTPDGSGAHLHFELLRHAPGSGLPQLPGPYKNRAWRAVDPASFLQGAQAGAPPGTPEPDAGTDGPGDPKGDGPATGAGSIAALASLFGPRIGLFVLGVVLLGVGLWGVTR